MYLFIILALIKNICLYLENILQHSTIKAVVWTPASSSTENSLKTPYALLTLVLIAQSLYGCGIKIILTSPSGS